MVLTNTKVIDGRDHLLGRLASIVAKELLAGQKIVIVPVSYTHLTLPTKA